MKEKIATNAENKKAEVVDSTEKDNSCEKTLQKRSRIAGGKG